MKKIIVSLAFASLLVGLSSCDNNFEQVNLNPVAPTTIDPVFLFSNAQLSTDQQPGTLQYEGAIVQQFVSPFGGVLAAGNFNQNNVNNTPVLWNRYYEGPVKLLTDVITRTQGDQARSNLYNMARIWRAYVFQVLTDTYGDIPYSEAGQAYLKDIKLPKYDTQQEIYNSILDELDKATAGLNASGRIETGDLLYKGDITKWKRFGNSLLLRAAMRLTKVDPQKAQQYVQKAVAGGVLQSNADNAIMQHSVTYQNPLGSYWNGTEKANFYLAKPFLDQLKNTNDPRLKVIAVKYADPTKNPDQTTESNKPEDQVGMPMGFDNGTIATSPNFQGAIGAAYKYSQINRRTIGRVDVPQFFVTHAQTQLLLAEAAQRGWVQGKAEDYYNAGVRAHMQQMAQLDPTAAIPTAEVDAYLAANPFDLSKALEQINTQYWIASMLNFPEAWANLRRSGFPNLPKNPYPTNDTGGEFIRRLTYPVNEKSVNTANYNAAVSKMGNDNLVTRVWWDK